MTIAPRSTTQQLSTGCMAERYSGQPAERFVRPDFRPVSDRARARLGSILVVMREGEPPLPPIEVWAWHGEYYVLDGHHRVAAARALGSNYISAHVVEVG
jgi:hypothetical protein